MNLIFDLSGLFFAMLHVLLAAVSLVVAIHCARRGRGAAGGWLLFAGWTCMCFLDFLLFLVSFLPGRLPGLGFLNIPRPVYAFFDLCSLLCMAVVVAGLALFGRKAARAEGCGEAAS